MCLFLHLARPNTHILNTCIGIPIKLGLLYRKFQQADQQTLCQLYKTLVLPKLDCCSNVCMGPCIYRSCIEKLESVQGLLLGCAPVQKLVRHLCNLTLYLASLLTAPCRQNNLFVHFNSRIHHPDSVRVLYKELRTSAWMSERQAVLV